MGGVADAQCVLRINARKMTGARSARGRTRGKNPLDYIKNQSWILFRYRYIRHAKKFKPYGKAVPLNGQFRRMNILLQVLNKHWISTGYKIIQSNTIHLVKQSLLGE